jgi:hypothetical protein
VASNKGLALSERRKLEAAAANLVKDIGATAAARHAAFKQKGGSENQARQTAEYHARMGAAHFAKLPKKDTAKAAGAAYGGAARTQLRALNAAAGLVLSEDASKDTQIVDNLRRRWRRAYRHSSSD